MLTADPGHQMDEPSRKQLDYDYMNYNFEQKKATTSQDYWGLEDETDQLISMGMEGFKVIPKSCLFQSI